MTTPPTPDCWASYSGSLRAILDEYARAIRDLERLVQPLKPKQYLGATSLSDDTFAGIRSIMTHVIGAAHVYVDYIDDATSAIDRGRRVHECRCDTPEQAIDSVWEAFGRMVEILGHIKTYSDEELEKVSLVTRWDQRFDLEQMLEHAIVHILRHRRQIERWLAA